METKHETRKKVIATLAVVGVVACATYASAFNPTTGVGKDFYDMAAGMTEGPIGATIGLGGMAMAAFFLFKQAVLPAVGAAMGSIAIVKSTDIVTSFGFKF